MIAALLFLVCLYMLLPTVYAAQTSSGIPPSELESRIDNYIARYIGQSAPGVAVVVVKDGEIIFSRGYGYASIEAGIPVDPATTIFEWGSASKPFVWVSVMQLVEQGKIDLDENVNVYLPEYLNQQLAFEMPFTVRDLLNHTAGFAEQPLGSFITNQAAQYLSLEDALLLMQPRQIYTPSTVSAYSNFGTALAAYVVGYVGGQGFVAFERENIFIPSGIDNALNQPDWINNYGFLQAKATGYMPDGRGGFREGIQSYVALYPAGAINGTAEDLARFIISLTPPQGETGPLFENPYSLAEIFTSSSLDPANFPGTHHGFIAMNGAVAFGHPGGTTSFTSNFAIVPDERLGIVVMSNAPGELDIAYGLVTYFLANDIGQIQTAFTDLPSAKSVEGNYKFMRRMEGDISEVLSYIANPIINITAIDENTISVTAGMLGSAIYRQVEPYVFRIISFEGPAMPQIFSELRFKIEDGNLIQVHVGNGHDFMPLPPGRTIPFLIAYAVFMLVSALFFLLVPPILFIHFLRSKKKQGNARFKLFYTGLLLSGSLLLLNNLICMGRIFAGVVLPPTAELAPHIWINHGLAVLSCLIFTGFVLYLRKEKALVDIRSKVLYCATTAFVLMMFLVLHNWNFFIIL